MSRTPLTCSTLLPQPPPPDQKEISTLETNEKENQAASIIPPAKKRKAGSGGIGIPSDMTTTVKRQTLAASSVRRELSSAVSSLRGREISPSVSSDRGSECPDGNWEGLTSVRDYADKLLNEKHPPKAKYDFKGKCEVYMAYTKRLKQCIREMQQVEEGHIMEKENLEKQMAREEAIHEETLSNLKRSLDEMGKEREAYENKITLLERSLYAVENDKRELTQLTEQDAHELRKLRDLNLRLDEDGSRVRAELVASIKQVENLQDVNRRLQEYNTSLQQYNSKLQGDAAAAQEALAVSQREKAAVMAEIGSFKGMNMALQSRLESAQRATDDLSRQQKVMQEETRRTQLEIQRLLEDRERKAEENKALALENARYKDCTGKSAAELEQLSIREQALKQNFLSQNEVIAGLKRQQEVLKQQLELSEGVAEQRRMELVESHRRIAELESKLADTEMRFLEGEQLRRKLHNTIQELKGNIRVFCRVRPMLPDEEEDSSDSPGPIRFPTSVELMGRGIEVQAEKGQQYSFTFDKVFGPEVEQSVVFEELSQLVQSALDGYKVCIFAYGQTGSGKTYTMLGATEPDRHRGMIPRSLEQIFMTSKGLEQQGWRFSMQASMLEIHNETIRDLLSAATARASCGLVDLAAGGSKQHVVKHDANGNTTVTDLTLVEVTSWREVATLLARAAQYRSVGKTAMNERSSRSHCVFTLRITGVNDGTEQQVNGVLNLIDLAGSERLSRSGATGERLKETQAINKSLSSLGDVISAIANKEAHIPYRNSKLTYLLQPCLGGDSKTLMFVNIAPDRHSEAESLCSLRFAAKVNSCEIGVPRRHARLAETTKRDS
ncbi:hypothetical protein CBR_g39632 [Chara braunii]|uniref:Kinesin-like protein n=1 Tax=Chara braunii TaxID=69332 RepID=A0A388K1D0_CHABU|nr:hypothetical protein CBR_g39632 [Chara braunii]|eukprot:GBG63848.1 hypothetical protein CBR_g39632 [Chara braunii]